VLRQGQRPAVGGVGFGAVGVEPGQVVVHQPAQVGVGLGGGGLGEDPVDGGEVDVLRGGRGQVRRRGDRGDDGHLVGGDHPVGAAGGHRRQLFQHPPGPHQLPGGGRREPGVAAQPRAHRPLAVVLRCLGEVGDPDGAGQFGVDPVPGPDQLRRPVQQLGRDHRVEIVGGERNQGRLQLSHDNSRALRTLVR
jgi:hypothetical protein